jgi:hypothetical protein
MAQPAVFVIQKDGTVVYQWAIEPALVGASLDNTKLKLMSSMLDESGRRQGSSLPFGDLGGCSVEAEWTISQTSEVIHKAEFLSSYRSKIVGTT